MSVPFHPVRGLPTGGEKRRRRTCAIRPRCAPPERSDTLNFWRAFVFVTLEGVEGCGKTSQAQTLAEVLRDRGKAVVVTREPGRSPIGKCLRPLLLSEQYAVT